MKKYDEKSCGAIIFKKFQKQWKVLLIKQINKDWGFPKGHMEAGENELETAIREVKEEVSLIGVDIDTKYQYSNSYVLPSGKSKIVVYFLASYNGNSQPKYLKSELLKAKFVPVSRAMCLISKKSVSDILKLAWSDFKVKNRLK